MVEWGLLALLPLLVVRADVNCPNGWQAGSGSTGARAAVGSTSSKEECSQLVLWKCPSANGATWTTGGSCTCEFDIWSRNTTVTDAQSCIFWESLQKEECNNGWQAGRKASTEAISGGPWAVNTRAECFELCRSKQPDHPFLNAATIDNTGNCDCHVSSPGSSETANKQYCEFTCQAGGGLSRQAAFNGMKASQGVQITLADCTAAVAAACPDVNGLEFDFANKNCFCVGEMTGFTPSNDKYACFMGRAVSGYTVTSTESTTTKTTTTTFTTLTTTSSSSTSTVTSSSTSSSTMTETTTTLTSTSTTTITATTTTSTSISATTTSITTSSSSSTSSTSTSTSTLSSTSTVTSTTSTSSSSSSTSSGTTSSSSTVSTSTTDTVTTTRSTSSTSSITTSATTSSTTSVSVTSSTVTTSMTGTTTTTVSSSTTSTTSVSTTATGTSTATTSTGTSSSATSSSATFSTATSVSLTTSTTTPWTWTTSTGSTATVTAGTESSTNAAVSGTGAATVGTSAATVGTSAATVGTSAAAVSGTGAAVGSPAAGLEALLNGTEGETETTSASASAWETGFSTSAAAGTVGTTASAGGAGNVTSNVSTSQSAAVGGVSWRNKVGVVEDENATATETQITSTRSTTTATSTSMGTGTTSTATLFVKPWHTPADVAASIEQVMAGAATAPTGGAPETRVVQTSAGKLTVVPISALRASVLLRGEGNLALVPSTDLLQRLPQGATVSLLTIAGQADAFADVGGELLTPAVGLSIYDAGGQRISELGAPLLFRLPDALPGVHSPGSPACVFLEVSGNATRWSGAGVRRATRREVSAAAGEQEGQWCVTDHLSIFAALTQTPTGCTNLELFSAEAISALEEHEGWWESWPSISFFSFVGLLVLILLLGTVRECCALSMGRTPEPARVGSCVLLRYRYGALLRSVKDMLCLLNTGIDRMQLPTLRAGVQRSLAVKAGISVACVSEHCWHGGPWLDARTSLPRAVLCRKLEIHSGGVEAVIKRELESTGICRALRRLGVTFLACHPLLDSLRLGASSMTVRKRATLQVASFIGVLATNAMIFSFSGAQRPWEADVACPILATSYLFILVASLVSVGVNVLPNAFLMDIARTARGRPCWSFVFWVLTLLYLQGACLLVLAALANLNPVDQAKWHRSMEWALAFKLLLIPAARALLSWMLLEYFLREAHRENVAIKTLLGLEDPYETHLPTEATDAIEEMAMKAITAEDLVNFMALLGDRLMLDYVPESSTSAEVFHGAVSHLCKQTRSFEHTGLHTEVVEVHGLKHPTKGHASDSHLSCAVLHLGVQEQHIRQSIAEQRSSAELASIDGTLCRRCSWNFRASFPSMGYDDALGFAVTEMGRTIGVACLPVSEVLRGRGYLGELLLHAPGNKGVSLAESFKVPLRPAAVSDEQLTGSRGVPRSKVELSQQTRLLVKVHFTPDYLQALALHELKKLRWTQPAHQSEADRSSSEQLLTEVLRLAESERPREAAEKKWDFAPASVGYCAPHYPCETLHGRTLPPERIVVHSLQGNFLHLVTALLADILGGKDAYEVVQSKLLERDFHGLLDLLRQRKLSDVRFWIDMFAIDLDVQYRWHKDLLMASPALHRSLKRACSTQMLLDMRQKVNLSCGLPRQLLVLDQDSCLFQDSTCVASVQLARSMGVRQRMLLHPAHMRGPYLGDQLKRLGAPAKDAKKLPWTVPYAQDRGLVCNTFSALVVQAVRQQTTDDVKLRELHLSDVAASFAAMKAGGHPAFDGGDSFGAVTGTS